MNRKGDLIKREDAKKWLTNLKEDCGRYQDLWLYAEALEQIIELFSVEEQAYCPNCGAKMEGERR